MQPYYLNPEEIDVQEPDSITLYTDVDGQQRAAEIQDGWTVDYCIEPDADPLFIESRNKPDWR